MHGSHHQVIMNCFLYADRRVWKRKDTLRIDMA